MEAPRVTPYLVWALRAIAAVVVLAVVAGLITSKLYWGYFFAPPEPDPRILNAKRFTHLSAFWSRPKYGPETTWVPDEDRDFEEELARALRAREGEDAGAERLALLEEVKRRGQLQSLPPVSEERVAAAYESAVRHGVLEQGEPPYYDARWHHGIVLEAEGADGARLVYVGAAGPETSNDHHPAYLLLWSVTPSGELELLSRQTYYFDVAGIEGARWWFFAILFWVPLFFLVPLFALIAWMWQRHRVRTWRMRSDSAAPI